MAPMASMSIVLSLLLSLSLSRPPRSVWVPMQNRRPPLSLLAKPLDRPPKKSVADATPEKSVWLLSFPYLPMRGLYQDATPLYPCKIAFTVYLCFRNCCDVPLPRLLPDATTSLVSKALPYSLLPDAPGSTSICLGKYMKKRGLAFELSFSANAWFVPGRDPKNAKYFRYFAIA